LDFVVNKMIAENSRLAFVFISPPLKE